MGDEVRTRSSSPDKIFALLFKSQPLGQPNKAIGLESQIEPWLAHAIPCSLRREEIGREEQMKAMSPPSSVKGDRTTSLRHRALPRRAGAGCRKSISPKLKRFRRWTTPSPSFLCAQVCPSGRRLIISAMEKIKQTSETADYRHRPRSLTAETFGANMCSARVLRHSSSRNADFPPEAPDANEEDLASRARLATLSCFVRSLSFVGPLLSPTDPGSGIVLNSTAVAFRLDFGLQRPGCFALFGHLWRSARPSMGGNFRPRPFGLGL